MSKSRCQRKTALSVSALKFVETPYHANILAGYLLEFRERGFVVMRDVFARDSVDVYRTQIEAGIVRREDGKFVLPTETELAIAPTRAPRLRSILPGALSPALMQPHPALFEVAWLIQSPNSTERALGWHKDRNHEGLTGSEYHYPADVHIGMYFEDTTEETGPTQAIERSHRDLTRSPYNGGEPVSFLCRKQDVVLWDQRLWHRATERKAPGYRIFGLFGFYPAPTYHGAPYKMTGGQREAWLSATDPSDQVFYGGTFAPERQSGT